MNQGLHLEDAILPRLDPLDDGDDSCHEDQVERHQHRLQHDGLHSRLCIKKDGGRGIREQRISVRGVRGVGTQRYETSQWLSKHRRGRYTRREGVFRSGRTILA